MAVNNLGAERKFKPAGKNAKPKICSMQFVKGKEKSLIALNSAEYKNLMPKEIAEGMSIQAYNGGIQQERA